MTNEEAIKIIEKDALHEWSIASENDDCYWQAEKYIKAYSMAIEALKKQIPMKCNHINSFGE